MSNLSLSDFIESNYMTKQAHFPLSEPKTIYISRENHREYSLERIKELHQQLLKKEK